MPTIRCFVGDLKVRPHLPEVATLTLDGRSIADYFREASRTASGSPALTLVLDPSRRHTLTSGPGAGVDAFDLQLALAALTNNPSVPAGGGVTNIGLVLADTYAHHPSAYGFMFDLGFANAVDDSDPTTFREVPREGCAIFLQRIRDVRPDDDDFRNQVATTATHELGHVFNLWHLDEPTSFMFSRTDDRIVHVNSFDKEHAAFLREAIDPRHAAFVLPGGSRFGDRGPIGPSGDGLPTDAPDPGLRMEIRLSHDDFWSFEPVELEVRLRVTGPGMVRRIPDEIDPGYERFEIWITRPNGERVRYRPSVRYCPSPRRLTLRHRRPFRRDIAVFGQADGYTFRSAGPHTIQCLLRLPSRPILSNAVRFDVRPAAPGSATYRAAREVLTTPAAAKLLFYRSRAPGPGTLDRLAEFARRHRSTPTSATIHYALGQALAKRGRAARSPALARAWTELAHAHLRRVIDHPRAGEHQRDKAHRLLNRMSEDR